MTDNFSARLFQIALFLGAIWAVFLIDPAGQLWRFALVPKGENAVIGIAALPFLHGGYAHIVGNTTYLAILLPILALVEKDFWLRVALMIALSGGLLWLIGPPGETHIGASCLVFAVIGYLGMVAIYRGQIVGAVLVAALAWWQSDWLIDNIIPNDGVTSGLGHLSGLIAGAGLAILWGPRR